MSRTDTGTSIRRVRPTPNVYTVLAVIATLVLAVGVIYVGMSNVEQTHGEFAGAQPDTGSNPFHLIAKPGK
jgi:hypothetical protein